MLKFIAPFLLLVGCTTTSAPTSFKEPGRSYYYLSCLSSNVMVTTCACMEKKAVEVTGVTEVTEENQEQVVGALKDAFLGCQEETKKQQAPSAAPAQGTDGSSGDAP